MPSAPAPSPASTPDTRATPGACDTHIHMLAAPGEFSLWEKRVEDPAESLSFDDFIARYRAQMRTLGIERTVVVHSILYGLDNTVTLRAIEALGRETTRAITLVPDDVDDQTLNAHRDAGSRGVRLNYVHGGVLSFEGAVAMAPRLADRGMHLQMLVHTDQHMAELDSVIRALPVPVVIDHIGWPPTEKGVDEPGFAILRRLLADGHAYAKLSGIYRLSNAPYEETDALVAALVEANPERCLWGSDYPFVMLADAQSPDAGTLFDAFTRVVAQGHRETILTHNPARLYGF